MLFLGMAHYYPSSTSSMATICWHIFYNNILIYIIQSFFFSRIYNVMSQKLFVIFFYILNQLYYWFQNEIFGLPFRLSSFVCYLVFFRSLAFSTAIDWLMKLAPKNRNRNIFTSLYYYKDLILSTLLMCPVKCPKYWSHFNI